MQKLRTYILIDISLVDPSIDFPKSRKLLICLISGLGEGSAPLTPSPHPHPAFEITMGGSLKLYEPNQCVDVKDPMTAQRGPWKTHNCCNLLVILHISLYCHCEPIETQYNINEAK